MIKQKLQEFCGLASFSHRFLRQKYDSLFNIRSFLGIPTHGLNLWVFPQSFDRMDRRILWIMTFMGIPIWGH